MLVRRPRRSTVLYAAGALALSACSAGSDASPAAAPHATQVAATQSGSSGPTVLTETTGAGRKKFVVRSSAQGTSVSTDASPEPAELDGDWRLPRVVVDVTAPEEPQVVALPGEFTYDAWSPDGAHLYLIEHRPPAGSGKYVVRLYDLASRALRADPIADKRTQGEEMAGLPLARAETVDGASVATLYVPHPSGAHGAGHEGLGRPHGPFVHLLFADSASAVCVDLPQEVGRDWTMTVVAGDRVRISGPSETAYEIDMRSAELTKRRAPVAQP